MHSTTRHISEPELRKGNSGMALTTLLICIGNRVGDKMLHTEVNQGHNVKYATRQFWGYNFLLLGRLNSRSCVFIKVRFLKCVKIYRKNLFVHISGTTIWILVFLSAFMGFFSRCVINYKQNIVRWKTLQVRPTPGQSYLKVKQSKSLCRLYI